MLNALILTTLMAGPTDVSDFRAQLHTDFCLCVTDGSPQQKPADKKHEKDLQNDVEQGTKYSKEVEKEFKFSKNQEYIDRVNRIGSELADIARREQVKVLWGDKRLNPFTYRFHVIENDSANAFSIPGGFIYVHEGLLKFIESDDELAGVLAHEVAHASFRHLATLQKEYSKLSNVTLPLIIAAILAGGKSGGDIAMGTQLYQQVKVSGWSEEAELSADYGGLQYMLKSKYNPTGLLTFMERLAQRDRAMEGGMDIGIFRTHPPSRKRAEALTKQIVSSGRIIRRSEVTTSYRTLVKENGENTEIWFGGKRIYTFTGPEADTRAKGAAERLNGFFDQTPEMYEVSIRNDGTVVGKGKVLFRIVPEDAEATKSDLNKLQASTEQALKRSVSYLSSMVWLAR